MHVGIGLGFFPYPELSIENITVTVMTQSLGEKSLLLTNTNINLKESGRENVICD